MDGSEQSTTLAAQHFSHELLKRFAKPVYGMDERLTTKTIRQTIFEESGYKGLQKTAIDSLVAKLILEDWMLRYA